MIPKWLGLALLLSLLAGTSGVCCLDPEESAFLDIINDYRASYGLGSLSLSPTLTVAAELHSQDMADNNYFSHYSQDGRSPVDRVQEAGYTYSTVVGENIAGGYVTAASVFEGWRNSPGHNHTMLYPSFVVIGIGRVYNSSSHFGWYWTTDFGGYDDSGEPPPPPPPTVPISSPTHPSQNTWYQDRDPTFDWDDVAAAEGYSYALDHGPVTTPDTVIDGTASSKGYSDLADGTWYFHLRVKTSEGWGQATHYRVRIDGTAPGAPTAHSPTHPDPDVEYADDSPHFSWSVPPDTSGISGYSYAVDNSAETTPDMVVDTTSTTIACSSLAEGVWYLHVRAMDQAGNWGETGHVRVKIGHAPSAAFEASPRTGFEPLLVEFHDSSTSASGIVEWLWDFGDGSTSTLQNPSHFYEEEGSYTVVLTVREADEDTDSIAVPDCIQVERAEPPSEIVDEIWEGDRVIGGELLSGYVDADAFLDPSEPWMNHGHGEWLLVDSGGNSACIGIDLSSIPSGNAVTSALLGLYLESISSPDSVFLSGCPSTGEWAETEVTWATRPDPGPDPCLTVELAPGMEGYAVLDVTPAIQDAAPDGYLTLFFTVSSGSGEVVISAREGSVRPVVLVEHAPGQIHTISLVSMESTGLAPNMGQISIDGTVFELPGNVSAASGCYGISYLQGYLFTSWESSGGVLLGNRFDSVTSLTIGGDGQVMATGELDEMDLCYDDGSADYSTGRNAGEMVGVVFSPPLVGSLSSIQVYISKIYASTNNTCLLHVMSPDYEDLLQPLPLSPSDPGWITKTLSQGPRMTGDFVIALEYLNDNYPRVGVDSGEPGGSVTYRNLEWVPYHSNYMIRCALEIEQPPMRTVRIRIEAEPAEPEAGLPIEVTISLDPPVEGAMIEARMIDPGAVEHDLSGTTNSTGSYSCSLLPVKAGNWELLVYWAGNEDYVAASAGKIVNIDRGYPLIECSLDTFLSYYGDPITISGTVSPVAFPLRVEFRFMEGPWEPLMGVLPQENLSYAFTWVPPEVGEYEFRVVWDGDEDFRASSSYALSHHVMRGTSAITLEIDRTVAEYGSEVTLAGAITPPKLTVVEIQFWREMEWETIGTSESDDEGRYSFKWRIDMVGTALVQARWAGDEQHREASSDALVLLSEKAPAEISLAVESNRTDPNQTVRACGMLTPDLEMEIMVTIIEPGGYQTQIVTRSNSTGGFEFEFDPDKLGEWRATATWTGNNLYEGCSSSEVKVWVDVPECPLVCGLAFLAWGALHRRKRWCSGG